LPGLPDIEMKDTVHPIEVQGSPLVGTIFRDVTWGDCDPAGIIYYPNYYRWIDSGTWNLIFMTGLTPATLRSEYPGMDTPVAACNLEFHNPAPFGAKAEVRSFVEHWSGKSFKVHHDIIRGDGVRLARGSEIRVWVGNTPGGGMRAHKIPDSFKNRFFTPR